MISHLTGTLTKKTEARQLPHPAPTPVGAPLSRAPERGIEWAARERCNAGVDTR